MSKMVNRLTEMFNGPNYPKLLQQARKERAAAQASILKLQREVALVKGNDPVAQEIRKCVDEGISLLEAAVQRADNACCFLAALVFIDSVKDIQLDDIIAAEAEVEAQYNDLIARVSA